MAKAKFDLRNPNVRNPLIIFFIAVIVGYFYFDYMYKPNSEQISRLEKQRSAKDSELRTINALKPQLNRLRIEKAEATAKLDSLRNIFPDQREVPKLIRELTSFMRESDVVTTGFHPIPDVVKEYYVENKYRVAVAGNYHNLGQFFSNLANFQLIINLSSVTITANPNYSADRPENSMEPFVPSIIATFEMTTFSSRR